MILAQFPGKLYNATDFATDSLVTREAFSPQEFWFLLFTNRSKCYESRQGDRGGDYGFNELCRGLPNSHRYQLGKFYPGGNTPFLEWGVSPS